MPENLFSYKAHKTPSTLRPIVFGTKGPTETASETLADTLKQALPDYLTYFLTYFLTQHKP